MVETYVSHSEDAYDAYDCIYGDWRQRIVATFVACVAETLCLRVGHEFGHQVVVLFLQSSLSSCVVSKACT